MKIYKYFIFLSLIVSNCVTSEDNVENYNLSNNHVHSNGIELFNKIFSDIPIQNKFYEIDSAVLVIPSFDYNYIREEDTANISFFQLFDNSDSFFIGINRELCYAFILNNYNGNHYPHNYVVYPDDFTALNQDNYKVSFLCDNNDRSTYRELSFDKQLYGKWKVDSIKDNANNITNGFSRFSFDENIITIDREIKNKYELSGFNIIIDQKPSIFRIFSNSDKIIFYSMLNSENKFYFLTKIRD